MKKIFFSIIMAAAPFISDATDVLTLEACKQMATENNISIKHATNDITASEEQMKQAYTNFFPTVSGNGTFYHSPNELVDIELMGQRLTSGKNIYFFGVNATMPLYAGGQINNGYKLSKVGLEASKIEKQKALRDIYIQTEKYYWQIAMLNEKMKTMDSADSLLADVYKTAVNAVTG